MKRELSEKLFEKALEIFPGGVNSPVRAFGSVGGKPPFINRGRGPYLWDEDDNKYIDYVGSWGPAILGHADPKTVQAVQEAAEKSFSFGAPTEAETRLGEMVRIFFPSMERLRFVSSGTEAAMSAVRLARGVTGRDKIIKFEGCYHGHADHLLVKAGSGLATFGVPSSAGVPDDFAKQTLVARFNNLESVEKLFAQNKGAVAAVIVEPVAGNMGCIPPIEGFLKGLRNLCTREGVMLIFDEVMTGFRVARGGAQELYNIRPDLTCLGKIIGGGLPVGAFGGRREWMEQVAPLGPVYQAGTLSGNPLAMAAGIKTLEALAQRNVYETLEETTQKLVGGLKAILRTQNIPHQVQSAGSMWTLFFSREPVVDFETAQASNETAFKKFFLRSLEKGVYLPPSRFETAFVSLAHKNEEIEKTLAIFDEIFGDF